MFIKDLFNSTTSFAPVSNQVNSPMPYEAELFRPSVGFESTEIFEPLIVSDPEIQGGVPCLKNTRITISGILESMDSGHAPKEISETLKDHFKVTITPEDIERAVTDYKVDLALIASGE